MNSLKIIIAITILCLAQFSWSQSTMPMDTLKRNTDSVKTVQKTDKPKVKKASKKVLKPQTTCPVQGDAIDKSLFVDYQGKRIYVCCSGCIDVLKKDPEKYIKKLESMGQGVETITTK
jgi:YHS domain-containing protein